MARKVNVEFYQVEMPDKCKLTLEQIFDHASELLLKERCRDIGNSPVRLETHHKGQGIREGDVVRIRMDNIPNKARLDSPCVPLGLAANEGLGNETAFLYHCHLRVLAIQRNQMGVLPSAWAKYFSEIAGLSEGIELTIILQEDAMRRLAGIQEFRKFYVECAAPGSAKIFKDLGLAPKAIAELMDLVPRAKIKVELSSGKGSKSLPKAVRKVATRLFNLIGDRSRRKESYRLAVSGLDETDQKQIIDLINDRMIEVAEIERTGRNTPYKPRRDGIREAFHRRLPELQRILSR